MRPHVILTCQNHLLQTPREFKLLKLKTTGHEKLHFTAVLSAGIKITANEVKAVALPLMIIFKNLVKPPSGNFLPRVMVQGIKGGTMTDELMAKTYANDLCGKRPGAYFQQPKSLLIMDSVRAHTSKEATDALGGNLQTRILTSHLKITCITNGTNG